MQQWPRDDPSPVSSDVVIVGGGLGAIRTAQELRDLGHVGRVVLVSDESDLPYDRPPLSKEYLLQKATDETIRLVEAEKLAELEIDVLLDKPASALDRANRRVLLHGRELAYDQVIIATGARPITLPMLDGLDNVMVLRSVHDARRLRAALTARPVVGIVGGGFIGLEIAAAARRLGCDAVVIEAAETPLAPVIGPELGRAVQRFHEDRGVVFRCGTMLSGSRGDGRAEELELADGSRIAVDIVVVGVGVKPNVDWLHDSGLELHRGLVCDALGRTADPHVFGAGDVVCRHFDGTCHPTGHWTATGDHGRVVANVICGEDPGTVVEDNYFWSDQFDARLQFVGVVPREHRITYVAGGPDEESFVALCSTDEQVTAVFAMNSARDFIRQSMPLRRGQSVPAPA
jgi:3-phenylpropionate/trans-cinnamate dioxygenase ferredoxin reductase subunit